MTIPNSFENIVLESNLPTIDLLFRGKVRDIYDLGGSLLFVASDRISAFDVILSEGIPGKGQVLTQFSVHWFKWLSGLEGAPQTHLIMADFDVFPEVCKPYRAILSGRSMIVKKAKPILVECIVRGYLSGSGWKEYQEKGSVSGIVLPKDLVESQQLPEPIFTPSSKADVGDHDVNITFEEMQESIGGKLAEALRAMSLLIYTQAAKQALSKGIIIADTKMEFGLDAETGDTILIDELLTPDSSRFWPADDYEAGRAQKSFDKQYIRDYLLSVDWDKTPPPPRLPEDVVRKSSERYKEAFMRLTGK